MPTSLKQKISYFLDPEIGDQYYGEGHPMKPHRVRLTHELVTAYRLYKEMTIFRPNSLSKDSLAQFHLPSYIDFLQTVTPENKSELEPECARFLGRNSGDSNDCPVFTGLFRLVQRSAGASVAAADLLNFGRTDIAINWGGGFHHAKKSGASGFCYINDIVLAILRLLRHFDRVLYVDIDVHHGDGVEEAFYCNDRVLTLSFHKGGNFFPGTGRLEDCGEGKGKGRAANFPLLGGANDENFFYAFRPTFDRVVQLFRPSAIVLQCGADSLAGDRLGCFNLSLTGHGRCVRHVIDLNLPTLVLGGGGYTVKNVARCWTYETAICLGREIASEIPANTFREKFAPDYRLHILTPNVKDDNSAAYIDATREALFENIRGISPTSVAMSDVPKMSDEEDGSYEEMSNESERKSDVSGFNMYEGEEVEKRKSNES